MKNLFGIILFNTVFWSMAVGFLEWIGVENFTLNVIIWVALLPFTLSVSEQFREP